MAVLLSGCVSFNCIRGSGVIGSEKREITGFKKITININASIYIKQDGKYDINIEAEDNILPNIRTQLKKDELIISARRCFVRHEPVKIYITSPEFQKINLTSSGKIIGENIINSPKLEIEINGSGNVDLELDIQKLITKLFGHGKITLAGNATDHKIILTGSGIINADELDSDFALVNLSGSGKCRLNVKEKLNINISGSGIVEYYGSPVINSNISGSGKVRKIK